MSAILGLLRMSRLQLVKMVALSVLAGLSNTALLYLVSSSGERFPEHSLVAPALFVVALLAYLGFQRMLLRRIVGQSERVLKSVRLDLSRYLLLSDYSVFEDIGRSKLLSAFTHDATILSQFWPFMVNLIVSLVTIVSSLLYLAFLAPYAFGLTVLTIAVGVLLYAVVARNAQNLLESARSRQDQSLSIVDDLLDGMKELKIGRERRAELYHQDLSVNTQAYLVESSAAKMTYHEAGLLGHGVFFLLVGLVAFVFPVLQTIDQPTRFAFLVVLLYLMGPLVRITNNLPFFANAQVSARRLLGLFRTLDEAQEISCTLDRADGAALGELASDWTMIRLDGVRYAYSPQGGARGFQLGPLSLDMHRGEILFFVGGNGSGKSTLGKLLTGLYTPTSGTVKVDDTLVGASNLDAYRQLFSAVYSDYHLFEGTAVTGELAQQRAATILSDLGLSSELLSPDSRRFAALSKGQHRRLALALAYLEDRPIYFFDEWAADQDPVFRERFYTRILPSLKQRGKTVIAVTHDDRYFHVADRIVELDAGRVMEVAIGPDTHTSRLRRHVLASTGVAAPCPITDRGR